MSQPEPDVSMQRTRRTRGKSKASLDLIEAARGILAEIQPATLRAVCYRLFGARLIKNMGKNETSKVSRLLVAAREEGAIPWDWIVDETRAPERIASWRNPAEVWRQAERQYRKDYWADQPLRVEVWSEKGTVRGTIAPVLNEFGVTFRVQHGYSSATSVHGAALESLDVDKPLIVFYIGDWDPSGLHMSAVDLPARIARYGGRIVFERIALAAKDVSPGTVLPGFDLESKIKDARYAWFKRAYGERCWELDALSPVILRQRVRDAIVRRLDLIKWNRAVEVEKAERQSMRNFMRDWNRMLSAGMGRPK